MPTSIEWVDAPPDAGGVDHLGMRVAGEHAYEQLIDFTNTVTWRPRYFSFLCWSLRKAWADAEKPKDNEGRVGIELLAWNAGLKRRDYVIVAATLADRPEAQRIAGSDEVGTALLRGSPVVFAADHLKARAGSFGVYAGVMRGLGMVASEHGVDIPSLAYGTKLADAFAASLGASGMEHIFSAESAEHDALRALGAVCGIDQLVSGAAISKLVAAEQASLRECIIDWSRFGRGSGALAPRILTIGILLEIHRAMGKTATLAEFRAATLVGVLRASPSSVLALPSIYDGVLEQWAAYQSHAYVTFALEVLLEVILDCSDAYSDAQDGREGVPVEPIIDFVVRQISSPNPRSHHLGEWWDLKLDEVAERLHDLNTSSRAHDLSEPILWEAIENADGIGERAHHASMLVLVALTRAIAMNADAWIGDLDRHRLPLPVLVDDFRVRLGKGETTATYLRHVIADHVVRQHHRNALRKLAADPSKYTALFTIEGPRLTPVARHRPNTSNPRFENAALMLCDLGLIDPGPRTLTADGHAVLSRIREECR